MPTKEKVPIDVSNIQDTSMKNINILNLKHFFYKL